MSWLFFQIMAMILSSLTSIVDKKLVQKTNTSPLLYLTSFAIVGFPVAVTGLFVEQWAGYYPAGVGILCGVLFIIAVWFYYKALVLDDISRLIPILRLSGVIKLLLLALFIGDTLTTYQYIAFGCVTLGAIGLSQKNKAQANTSINWLGCGYMLMASGLLAVEGLLESQIVLIYSPSTYLVWSKIGYLIGLAGLLLGSGARQQLWRDFQNTPWQWQGVLLGEQSSRLFVGLLSQWAMFTAGSAALTSVIFSLNPLLVYFLAVCFLGERSEQKDLLPKVTGFGLMSIGTGLLIFS